VLISAGLGIYAGPGDWQQGASQLLAAGAGRRSASAVDPCRGQLEGCWRAGNRPQAPPAASSAPLHLAVSILVATCKRWLRDWTASPGLRSGRLEPGSGKLSDSRSTRSGPGRQPRPLMDRAPRLHAPPKRLATACPWQGHCAALRCRRSRLLTPERTPTRTLAVFRLIGVGPWCLDAGRAGC